MLLISKSTIYSLLKYLMSAKYETKKIEPCPYFTLVNPNSIISIRSGIINKWNNNFIILVY